MGPVRPAATSPAAGLVVAALLAGVTVAPRGGPAPEGRVIPPVRPAVAIPSVAGVLPTPTVPGPCPDPRWPAPSELPRGPTPEAPYTTILRGPGWRKVPLGVGHLRPPEYGSYRWQDSVRLPLFAEPGGPVVGHLYDGWVRHVDGAPRWVRLQTAAMVETGYELATFIVLEATDDGWLRVRFAPPEGPPGGVAWVHRCHLEESPARLRYEPWSERLLSDEVGPLWFREEGAHVLRSGPSEDGEAVGTITGDHALLPSDVRGDWMRVEVHQPSDYCADPDVEVRVTEGWILWRDEVVGPRVWYSSRGC